MPTFDTAWLRANAHRVLSTVGEASPPRLAVRDGETEEQAQRAVVAWADGAVVHGCHVGHHLFHVPNGEARRKATAGRLRAMGVRAGVPDLFLLVPCRPAGPGCPYSGLALEMKREHGGSVSPEQETWLARLAAFGLAACVAHGSAEGIACVTAYLSSEPLDRWLTPWVDR